MGGRLKTIAGPSLKNIGDLAAILSTLNGGDVLFIDEIHRIPRQVEEMLYSAMEDFSLSIITGKDTTARTINVTLPPFTLVGATTRAGDLSNPLHDRFGIKLFFDYYNVEDLQLIVERTARVFATPIDDDAIKEIASRSRGTPRICNRIFKRIRDFATYSNNGKINLEVTNQALTAMEIDQYGLDAVDSKYLKNLIERFNGGPAGIDAIAATIGEEEDTITDMYEPFLLQLGFINRTPKGRVVTEKGRLYYLQRKKAPNNN
jgi:Holliday junction DNA helicase RuvB